MDYRSGRRRDRDHGAIFCRYLWRGAGGAAVWAGAVMGDTNWIDPRMELPPAEQKVNVVRRNIANGRIHVGCDYFSPRLGRVWAKTDGYHTVLLWAKLPNPPEGL